MFSNGLEFSSLVIEIYLEFEFCDLECQRLPGP